MKELTWRDPRCTRAEWARGEWDEEVDKVQWNDEATGLTCLAKRHPQRGHWCGYVGIPEGHPFYGKHYSDEEYKTIYSFDVHGGLTYASFCQEGSEETTICHRGPEKLWWIGFDCGYCQDTSPYLLKLVFSNGSLHEGRYKNISYVKQECTDLARQVHDKRTDTSNVNLSC